MTPGEPSTLCAGYVWRYVSVARAAQQPERAAAGTQRPERQRSGGIRFTPTHGRHRSTWSSAVPWTQDRASVRVLCMDTHLFFIRAGNAHAMRRASRRAHTKYVTHTGVEVARRLHTDCTTCGVHTKRIGGFHAERNMKKRGGAARREGRRSPSRKEELEQLVRPQLLLANPLISPVVLIEPGDILAEHLAL